MLAEPRILPLKVLGSNKRKASTELGQGILETRQRKPLKFIQVKSRPVKGSHEVSWKHSTESRAEPHNSKSSSHASLSLGVMWFPAAACLCGASFLLFRPTLDLSLWAHGPLRLPSKRSLCLFLGESLLAYLGAHLGESSPAHHMVSVTPASGTVVKDEDHHYQQQTQALLGDVIPPETNDHALSISRNTLISECPQDWISELSN